MTDDDIINIARKNYKYIQLFYDVYINYNCLIKHMKYEEIILN